jgi:hypothetical protein
LVFAQWFRLALYWFNRQSGWWYAKQSQYQNWF